VVHPDLDYSSWLTLSLILSGFGLHGDARFENEVLKTFLNQCTHDNMTAIAITEETFIRVLGLTFYRNALNGIAKKGLLETLTVVFRAIVKGVLIYLEKEEVHLFSCEKY